MDFTAIDFETAHAKFPCEIGLCRVENGKIVDTYSRLIKPACFPYMNPWCEKVHGISSQKLERESSFEELWGEIHPWLEDTMLLAHNAPFDMGVLRAALQWYDLAIPHSHYICSLSLAKKTWKGLSSYRLNHLCEMHGIRFVHHRAVEDAKASALLMLKAIEEIGVNSVDEFLKIVEVRAKIL